MDDIERQRDAFLSDATARFLADEGADSRSKRRARDAYRADLRSIKTAISNRPPEDLSYLQASLREKADEIERLARDGERAVGSFDVAKTGGLAVVVGAFFAMIAGGASVAAVAAVCAISAGLARLAGGEAEGLRDDSSRLRAASEDLRDLAEQIGEANDR